MTISSDQARFLAHKAVLALGAANNDNFAIMDDKTVETHSGWMFFYNTQEFIDTGDPTCALAGNGPILVQRSGEIIELPSSAQWEAPGGY